MSDMLIMLTGQIGSGKTTAADILRNYGFVESMFAEPLKNFAVSIGFEEDQVYGTQQQKLEINEFWGVSGREFLQKFGSDVCRDALPKVLPDMKMNGRTLWARVVERDILKYKKMVITDGRFLDEAALVKEYKGVIVRINREVKQSVEQDVKVSSHVSETELNQIKPDYEIDNNGTIEDLETKLLCVLQCEGCVINKAKNVREVTVAECECQTDSVPEMPSDEPDSEPNEEPTPECTEESACYHCQADECPAPPTRIVIGLVSMFVCFASYLVLTVHKTGVTF